MRRRILLVVCVALVLVYSAASAGQPVVARVVPRQAIAGERLTVSAVVRNGAPSCSARITQRAAPAARLPARKPTRGRVAWKWTLPVTASTGVGTVSVSCRRRGTGTVRFTIRALPQGDPVAGKTVFQLNCGGCHTLADAGTQGTSSDLDVKKPGYARVVDRVVNGKGLMPSFRNRFSPRQIADVAVYVSTVAGG